MFTHDTAIGTAHQHNLCGFITSDSATIRTLERVSKSIEHNSHTIWIEGESGTGKSKISHITATQQGERHTGKALQVKTLNITQNFSPSILNTSDKERALSIYLSPSLNEGQILSFQHHLTKAIPTLMQHVPLIIFRTLTASSYDRTVAHQISQMKQIFIDQHYNYISLQAIRHRPNDIIMLTQHFIKQFSVFSANDAHELSPRAIDYLQQLPWPNNVKDIQNFCLNLMNTNIERHVTTDIVKSIINTTRHNFPANRQHNHHPEKTSIMLLNAQGHVRPIIELEQEIVQKACMHHRGSKSAAARNLGMGRTTLYRKLNQVPS